MADAGGMDRAKLKQLVVPIGAVVGLVVIGVLVFFMAGGSSRKMSDGSDGTASDPGLKEVTPGVKIRDLKEGTGDPCPDGAEVKVHYTGWLENGTVFDSSKEGKVNPQPATFSLRGVIPGWTEGIPGMKKGGVRKLVIAPAKGYGDRGTPNIPGGSTLIFEVELIEIVPPKYVAPRTARADLAKLSDGTEPGAQDTKLQPLGNSGLLYRDIKVGTGEECPPGATPIMDYAGWLLNGHVFDSSWRGGKKPLDMPLGDLIQGWQQGVPGMKVGGIRKLVIPAPLGYGERGSPPDIPPNATLVFEIELLGLK
ncbi:MAG: FKBP-type peptidyl-prolyl cis-trans isomerase [Planctomycetes bacterium]|nr:FKBP-type peptidyl-prolyl cis-trans isomerase [Planctomycetota bacterium]